jgi:hypothetical protein
MKTVSAPSILDPLASLSPAAILVAIVLAALACYIIADRTFRR